LEDISKHVNPHLGFAFSEFFTNPDVKFYQLFNFSFWVLLFRVLCQLFSFAVSEKVG